MKVRKASVVATVAVLGAVTLTGCDKFTEPFQDAPRTDKVNDSPATVVTFPDGFSNASRKCDGPNMIYSAYHGNKAYAAIQVVPNDPRCK